METAEARTAKKRRRPRTLSGLRRARDAAALSQQELGKRAGLHQVSISELELENRGAHPSTVRKLAQALGVEPRVLFSAEEVDET
jgi:transcriptional regulator with XRE-family HTH domain